MTKSANPLLFLFLLGCTLPEGSTPQDADFVADKNFTLKEDGNHFVLTCDYRSCEVAARVYLWRKGTPAPNVTVKLESEDEVLKQLAVDPESGDEPLRLAVSAKGLSAGRYAIVIEGDAAAKGMSARIEADLGPTPYLGPALRKKSTRCEYTGFSDSSEADGCNSYEECVPDHPDQFGPGKGTCVETVLERAKDSEFACHQIEDATRCEKLAHCEMSNGTYQNRCVGDGAVRIRKPTEQNHIRNLLQVRIGGGWVSVPAGNDLSKVGKVACRELEKTYQSAGRYALNHNTFGPEGLACEGNELSLTDCSYKNDRMRSYVDYQTSHMTLTCY